MYKDLWPLAEVVHDDDDNLMLLGEYGVIGVHRNTEVWWRNKQGD